MKGRTSTKKRPVFGERLAAARHGRGLTQEKLAETLGLDRSTIRHYERSVEDPKLGFVLRCCAALKVPFEALTGTTSQPRESEALRRFNQNLLKLSPPKQQFALRLFSRQLIEISKDNSL